MCSLFRAITNSIYTGLLLFSLSQQWLIPDSKYTMKIELALVAFVWFVANSVSQFFWIVNTNYFKKTHSNPYEPGVRTNYYSLDTLHLVDFYCISVRSLLCITITSLKNIWESFSID